MSSYFSGSGDDGLTGLLGGGRVPKHHPRPEAFGSVDEASAALGLARVHASSAETKETLVQVQRDLYHLMAEVAAPPEHADRFRAIDGERVSWLEQQVISVGEQISMPSEFVLAGDSHAGAAFELARAIVRRAERAVVKLAYDEKLDNPHLLSYLNRLSSLCFVLALSENQAAGVDSPTTAKEP